MKLARYACLLVVPLVCFTQKDLDKARFQGSRQGQCTQHCLENGQEVGLLNAQGKCFCANPVDEADLKLPAIKSMPLRKLGASGGGERTSLPTKYDSDETVNYDFLKGRE